MKTFQARVLSILSVFALLAGSLAASPVELVLNGSFEDPVDPTFGPPATSWQESPPGPSAVNYPWLSGPGVWNLNGSNPDGDQVGVLAGNAVQTVGTLQADKLYTFTYWVYFRTAQPFNGELTTTLWTGDIFSSRTDGDGVVVNMPDPLPVDEWIEITATVNTSLPVFAGLVGQPLIVHLYSTGDLNETLLDAVSLTVEDAPPPAAVDYYVSSSTGSDANDGLTPSTAWQTFAPLSSLTLAPAATVHLRRGDTWPNSQLVLDGKGTPADPIRLTAYGEGPNPVITGINDVDQAAVIINNPSHWEIDSLDLRSCKVGIYLRFTGGNTDGTGAMFNNENITISNCHFQDINHEWNDPVDGSITVEPPFELSWGAGVWIGGNVPAPPGGPWPSETTNVLDGLTIRHCSFQNVQTGVGNGWYFPPAYKGRTTNVTLEDSWVTGCANGSFAFFDMTGIQVRRWDTWLGGPMWFEGGTTAAFLQDTDDLLIEDSEFAGNLRNNTGADGTGIDFEGNNSNIIFRHNVLHNNDGSGLLVLPTNGNNQNLQMLSNTLWNNARNPETTGQNNEARASNNSHSGAFTNNGIYLGADTLSGLSVYNNTTTWNNRFSANTGGNRISTPWSAVSGRPTGWGFDASVEGWGNENQWTGLAASGGALVGTSAGNDPYVESADTWVNTRERRWVAITMSQTAGTNGQVFFQTETDPTWTPAKSATFPIVADGTTRTYIVDMGQSAEYRGVVTKWRLDPTDASGSTMAIDSFSARIDPYVAGVAAISATQVDVVFNMAMLPGGGVFDPANYALSGTGQGTLATNPDTVSQIPTANGPVYRLTWNSGASTGDDAVLTVSNAQNARGYAIGSIVAANTITFATVADTTPPTASLSADNATRVATDITGTYTADDDDSGVDTVTLWVKVPGGAWASAGAVAGGTWTYTPAAGTGIYEFAVVATDVAGNSSPTPAGNDPGDATVLYNAVVNGPFLYDSVTAGAYTFPMTNDLDIVIEFASGATGSSISVSRTTGDVAPSGLDPAQLIDESLSITGTLSGEATITWNFDPASDDAPGFTGTIETVFQYNGGTQTGSYAVTPSGTSLTFGPVTGFSDWYAGSNSASVIDWSQIDF